MLDTRALDGWRRLRASLMVKAANDDPAAIRQLMEELAEAQEELAQAARALCGMDSSIKAEATERYSQGALARELGISRPAVTKWLAKAAR